MGCVPPPGGIMGIWIGARRGIDTIGSVNHQRLFIPFLKLTGAFVFLFESWSDMNAGIECDLYSNKVERIFNVPSLNVNGK